MGPVSWVVASVWTDKRKRWRSSGSAAAARAGFGTRRIGRGSSSGAHGRKVMVFLREAKCWTLVIQGGLVVFCSAGAIGSTCVQIAAGTDVGGDGVGGGRKEQEKKVGGARGRSRTVQVAWP